MFSEFSNIHVDYQSGQQEFWTGRKTTFGIEPQYWYQHILCGSLKTIEDHKTLDFGILGYACDEGVKRNHGRLGALEGPKAIREKLAKLPLHFQDKSVIDYGNIICTNNDLESCQNTFSIAISKLVEKSIFPIALGGGHDIAYAHYKGLKKVFPKKRIGIINFDAHFDLRPLETSPNSGTPFYQILSEFLEKGEKIDYFAIGIQKQSNTKQLFEIAEMFNVDFVLSDMCSNSKEVIQTLQLKLKQIITANDYLYLTIDMDGFSSAYASGVSAPSPLGFDPKFVYLILDFILKSKKVISCDIAELNPKYDQNQQTASLAAKLVDFIVMQSYY